MKRILIILSILILLGLGAWYFFGRGSAPLGQTISNLLPFGSGEGTTTPGTNTNGHEITGGQNSTSRAHLFKISDTPVAGAVSLIKSGNLVVRYVERANGHINDVDTISLVKTQIVNTTVPKVYEAIFKPSGSSVVFRTLRADGETIDSNSYALIPPTGTSTSDLYSTKVSGLPANISDLVTGSTTIFYTLKNLPQVTSSLFDGTKASTLWNPGFNNWRLSGAGDATLVLTTSASTEVVGYSYKLDARTGALAKLLGPLSGLIVTPNDTLTRLAYSYNTGGHTTLQSVNLPSGAIYKINPATLAEKCVWGSKAKSTIYCAVPTQGLASGEPDLWYKGITHYSDRIWRFNTDTDFANMVVDPFKDYGIDIDAYNLFLSPTEDYLFFQNKNDLSLWALKLN